jgi:hypothetical protein
MPSQMSHSGSFETTWHGIVHWIQLSSHCLILFFPPGTEILDNLPPELQSGYARDFYTVNAAFRARRVAQTTKNWEPRWEHWRSYIKPLGVDPYLQATLFQQRVQYLTGFAARVQSGYNGKGKQVQASTVSSAITAIGQKIALDINNNSTKVTRLDKFLLGLQIILDGYRIKDPSTEKKILVEANVP